METPPASSQPVLDLNVDLYTPIAMGRTLRQLDVVPSMGSRGCDYANAAYESAIGTIKLEQHVFPTRDAARLRVFDYIEAFYNPLRMHTTLGELSPEEFEAATIRCPPRSPWSHETR